MNIAVWLGIIAIIGMVGYIWWDKRKQKLSRETVIVCYSEQVGNTVIEHDKQYEGIMSLKNDIFRVSALNIIIPIPPANTFIPTREGKKKIYIIKIDAFRVGFRIPTLDNEIFIQERDNHGNLIKVNGRPKLNKHKWKYCDDVVEPDVKHWDENIMEKLRNKHRTKSDLLSKWLAPIILGIILVAGIVVIHLTTKYAGEMFDKVQTTAGETAQQVKENAGFLDNLIKKFGDKEQSPDPGGG